MLFVFITESRLSKEVKMTTSGKKFISSVTEVVQFLRLLVIE